MRFQQKVQKLARNAEKGHSLNTAIKVKNQRNWCSLFNGHFGTKTTTLKDYRVQIHMLVLFLALAV